jgi:two-component system, OmpR family, alkaline phosphatase synthesis response regulator PhoP
MTQRILVVDDDQHIVRLLTSYLEKAGMTTLTAYDGEEAQRVIRREHPDLIVLDLMLPGRDGWDITRWMRRDEQLASIPILMLTARVEDIDKILGLELGADDYVTKPFNPHEVVARVRAILRRVSGRAQASPLLQVGELRLDVDQHVLSVSGKSVEVTPTEFALLKTLMEHPNHAFTRTELLEKALGYSYEGMDRTLDSHIKNVRKKIEPDAGHPWYLETVFGVGYRMRSEKEHQS